MKVSEVTLKEWLTGKWGPPITYKIVQSKSSLEKNEINNHTSLAKSLLGKNRNDIIEINGYKYLIVEIIAQPIDIFKKLNYYELDKIIYVNYLHFYVPQNYAERKYSEDSQRIIDLKNYKQKSIDHYYKLLNPHIPLQISICCVPSSTEGKVTGIKGLVESLTTENRINASSCLYRYISVISAKRGGPRNVDTHLESIKVKNKHLIFNKQVFLIDDVITSGSTMAACKYLLEQAGAASVDCMALAKTYKRF